MRRATVTEAKNGLSALLAAVRAGEEVLIVDRGVPVARLHGVPHLTEDPDGRLARLSRAGLLRVSDHRGPVPEVLLTPPPRGRGSVLAALIAERREGR